MEDNEYTLKHQLTHLGFYMDDGTPYKTLMIYVSSDYTKVVNEWTNIRGLCQNIFIMPQKAAKWIADSIENKFWKSPENGGLPLNQHHLKTEIDGETIKIRRVMTVGQPDQKGFEIENLTRLDQDLDDPTFFATPDIMLIEGRLLKILREL